MFKSLAILDGILVALMVSFNGLLSTKIGNGPSLIVIHVVGLLGTLFLLIASRNRFKSIKGIPAYLFFAGALGIFNVLFNNISFAALGATLTVSLNLIGQLCMSMLLDHFGLLGLAVRPINRLKVLGVFIMVVGIAAMML